jgi:hypothetical protein
MKSNHPSPLEIVLQTVGAVGSVFAIITLFHSGRIVEASAATLFALVVGLAVYWFYWVDDYYPLKSEHKLLIRDATGTHVDYEITYFMRCLKPNVRTIVNRGMCCSGRVEYTDATSGDIGSPYHEGGTQSIITTFRYPLALGQELIHTLRGTFHDAFTTTRESHCALTLYRFKDVEVVVTFPPTRPPTRFAGRYIHGTKAESVPVIASANGLELRLHHFRPRLGSECVLEWTW